MRPQYQIVKQIIEKEKEVMESSRLLAGLGVSISVIDNLGLLDLAMDVIGYPPESLPDSQENILEAGSFSRAQWKQKAWEIDSGHLTVDEFVDELYRDYDVLILQQPHLFIKPDSNGK